MKTTIIDCPTCHNTHGEYLGKTNEGGAEKNIHKCLKCFSHVKTPINDGLNFA
jgi:hypothetical protein